MNKYKKLIIYGNGETAEIVSDYFKLDSIYEVIAFTVDREYLTLPILNELPVYPFDEIEYLFPPDSYEIFVAASFSKLNRTRTSMYLSAKSKGYKCANYISSKAFCWHNVILGENVFIFEGNVIQYKVKLGNNIIIWSGNHIGHQSIIEDNCFISSHVVISGFCHIKKNSFLGVNSSLNDSITISEDCVIGNGAIISKNTLAGNIYVGNPGKQIGLSKNYFNY
jgi:sugar O-acyltransferase (sialic acid O-acetyltransferase NeuD family)